MPWEPKMREPKIDITIHLDKWILLSDNNERGIIWIKDNLRLLKGGRGDKRCIVAPIFDPTDIFELIIVTSEQELRGRIFYEFIDTRSKRKILEDEVKEKSLANLTIRERRLRPQNTFIHPHPEPEENARVTRYDLRRSWISPEPFGDMREHDDNGVPDGSLGVATPEWLRRRR